jgi:hypothetical protein
MRQIRCPEIFLKPHVSNIMYKTELIGETGYEQRN